VSEIQYANSGGSYVAYRVRGEGPVDLIELSNGSVFSIDAVEEQWRWERYQSRLASFSRLITFDMRGTGLSDPVLAAETTSVDAWVDDAVAVLDAVGSEHVVLSGVGLGGPTAIALAVRQPERVRALVFVNAFARLLRAPDYPWGVPTAVLDRYREALTAPGPQSIEDLPIMAPSLVGDADFLAWWHRAGHRGAGPTAARAIWLAAANADLRSELHAIEAPALVVQSRGNQFVRPGHGRYLAEHLPNARYVELPGADHLPWVNDSATVAAEIEELVTGTRSGVDADRVLATVMFSDVVGSTARVVELGDDGWRQLLEEHDRVVRGELARHGGRAVKFTGDGLLASFSGPARAIACATNVRARSRQLGLETRIGIHTGEVEVRGDDIAGLAVHIASRVQSIAEPGEVLVSRTVADLVAGSQLALKDRGEHQLRGVPGTWRLFAVAATP
jgi:class 3 adenylate cyclase